MENKPIKNISDLGIDISNVKNLDVKEIDSEALKKAVIRETEKNKEKDKKKEKRSSKFNFTQPSLIDIPSGGKLYNTEDEDINRGKIKIYPLTLREEEILSTPRYIVDGTATIKVLDNCIDSDIGARDLLLYDYTYLLFYLRKISFGDEYDFEITCSNCRHVFPHKIRISDITFNELPKGFKDPYRIDLPTSKYTVIISMPRVRHITELDEIQKKLTDRERREYSGIADIYAIRTLAVLNEEGITVPKEDWVEFYKSLPATDRKELTVHSNFESGVDKVMEEATCPNCGTVVGGVIPITDDFFRF